MSMMSEVHQTKASGLKHALSDWREVILQVNSVFNWDLEWYPGVIAGVVTTVFWSIWYWDPTLISLIAFCGLLFSVNHRSYCLEFSVYVVCTFYLNFLFVAGYRLCRSQNNKSSLWC